MNSLLILQAVGDQNALKTRLLIAYATHQSPGTVPSVFDNYKVPETLDVEGHAVTLSLCDTAGSSDFDKLRPLSYKSTSVFLLCYSTADRNSFDRIAQKWHPEVTAHEPTVPIALVAHRPENTDGAEAADVVTTAEGQQLAVQINAVAFKECGTCATDALEDLFYTAAFEALKSQNKGSNGRCIVM